MNRRDDPAFRSPDGRFRLVIADELVTKILEMCLASYPLETGGVLIGHYNETLDTAVATRATGPPPDSQRRRTAFYRGTQGLHELLRVLWSKKEYYLGEWHYHPGRSCWSRVEIVRLPHTSSPAIRGWCDLRQGMTKVLPEIAND